MFYRKFNFLFQDVILVGCGGTGSRVVAPLIQTIKNAPAQLEPRLYVVDGDIFENKNLARQNCIERDMGRNKAIVMAERYGAALNFPVIAHPHMISPDENLRTALIESSNKQSMPAPRGTSVLWILCVDSIDARLTILNKVRPGDIVIDAGNEDTFGQVSIFDPISLPHLRNTYRDTMDIPPMSSEYELPFIPAPLTQYLNALLNPSPATGSCADLDQSLAINNLMAAGIINIVQNLAYNNKFYFRTNYFDLMRGNTTERMTPQWFNDAFNERTDLTNKDISLYSSSNLDNLTGQDDHEDIAYHLDSSIRSTSTFVDPAILAALAG